MLKFREEVKSSDNKGMKNLMKRKREDLELF
jgi:hypothetical protein